MTFNGPALKEARTNAGMSQADLAKGDCTPAMISMIENGKAAPSAELMGLLADKLGVSVEQLKVQEEHTDASA